MPGIYLISGTTERISNEQDVSASATSLEGIAYQWPSLPTKKISFSLELYQDKAKGSGLHLGKGENHQNQHLAESGRTIKCPFITHHSYQGSLGMKPPRHFSNQIYLSGLSTTAFQSHGVEYWAKKAPEWCVNTGWLSSYSHIYWSQNTHWCCTELDFNIMLSDETSAGVEDAAWPGHLKSKQCLNITIFESNYHILSLVCHGRYLPHRSGPIMRQSRIKSMMEGWRWKQSQRKAQKKLLSISERRHL